MKSEVEIRAKIGEIEDDDRYQAGRIKPATVVENAPLALVQLEMEATVAALTWVMESGRWVEKGGEDD